MDTFLAAVLQASVLVSLRQDEAVARQGVMNHQTASHLMDLSFIRDATEMSIPESYAVQGLSFASGSRDAMALRTSIHVPNADAAKA